MKIIGFFKKHPLAFALSYLVLHFLIFFILEAVITSDYYIIHSPIDDVIPFCEYFIVPYLLWFLYVPAIVLYLIKYDRNNYWKLALTLFGSNLICLVLYMIFPNGVMPKAPIEETTNIFQQAVNILYANDTPTNVCPSMHVLDTLAAHVALSTSKTMDSHPFIKAGSFVFLILICVATVTLKQHSIIDVFAAFILFAIMAFFAYKKPAQKQCA